MIAVTPPATIGMVGGGQLGRYALMAATSMGYRTVLLDPDPSAPAARVAGEHLVAPYDDPGALRRLAFDCDIVTLEFENPPALALDQLAETVPVAPAPGAVRVAQDRIAEKAFLTEQGFPVGPYGVLAEADDTPDDTIVDTGAVVKTARLGYDGRGQRSATGLAETLAAWADLGGVPCVVETRLALEAELSVLAARRRDGKAVVWPATENVHVDGILDLSVVPSPTVSAVLVDRAEGLALAIADALDYVGVLGVEFFVTGGELLVNEIAPRPHNSGHWTIDAAVTSQFEQQIRAVCGLGLGDTSLTCGGAAMVNLLGDLWNDGEPDWGSVFDDPHASLHLYGKAEPRPGRKMGHITVVADDPRTAAISVQALRAGLSN